MECSCETGRLLRWCGRGSPSSDSINSKSTSSKALESTKRGAEELMQAFGKEYRWWFCVFVILAFVLGIGLGLVHGYLHDQRPAVMDHASAMQAPEVKPRDSPSNRRSNRRMFRC